MSDIVIRAENLGKRYRIGERERYVALRDVLARAVSAPARMFKARRPASPNGDATHIWALKDVSFEVRQGEVVGLIGRNGSGKTTLLKILAQVTRPTEGHAQVRGRVGSLLEVGTGFHPELTGRENVFLSGAILGMTKAEILRKFDEIVAFAEVEKFIDTPLKHYSTGMQMRLAFAVAAHLEPEILLVDEVLAVGDAAFQKKCLGKMGDVASQGRTVMFVSHNMAAVRSLCTRGYLIRRGQIQHVGAIDGCIDEYLLGASADMPAIIETSNLPRHGVEADDDAFRITRVRLEADTGAAVVPAGQPLGLVMEFVASRPVDDLVFGYSVHSGDGVRIVECRSTETYGALRRLEPGKYSVECSIPVPLNAGLYSLHVGARCAVKALDHLPDVMTFRVDPSERLDSLWLQATTGFLLLRSRWALPTPVSGGAG
ncbi:MAG: ABC transporter ATP-binding protein [Terriglobia bacterium]|jgi:lipopolysaccharide transport system ATP-binding protein